MAIPRTIELERAFLLVFAHVVETGYSSLEDLEDRDPDDVRCDFDNALGETSALFELPDDVETRGQLADMVLKVWTDLDEYLIATTE